MFATPRGLSTPRGSCCSSWRPSVQELDVLLEFLVNGSVRRQLSMEIVEALGHFASQLVDLGVDPIDLFVESSDRVVIRDTEQVLTERRERPLMVVGTM
jgi:hypothetical protein